MLFVAYPDTANEFLKDHPELSDRIIVIDDVNNDSVAKGLQDIMKPLQETSNRKMALECHWQSE